MKKLFFIAMLLACQKINAQQSTGLLNKWNQKIEVELEKQQKLIITSNATPLIMVSSHINFDSLKTEFENWIKKIPRGKNPVGSATYVLNHDDRGKHQEFIVSDHDVKVKAYTLEDDEIAYVKITRDSVIFSYRYTELPKDIHLNPKYRSKLPHEWLFLNYCFVLNKIENLEDLDSDYIVNQIKNKVDKIDSKISDDALYGNPLMLIESKDEEDLNIDYKIGDFIAITGRASGGWVREKFMPELGISMELVLNGKYGFGLGVNQFFHFQNAESQNFKVNSSTFANIQFSPRKTIKTSGLSAGKISSESILTVSAGYMIRDKSGFFPKNTWRLSATFPVTKHLYAEPELFFNDAFKRIYPGIRIKIM